MNQLPYFWSLLNTSTSNYIDVSTTGISLSYLSGSSDTFDISSNISYVITPSDSWIDVSVTGSTGNYTVTIQTLSTNTGETNMVGSVIIQNIGLGITKTVTIIQTTEPQPIIELFIDGNTFNGNIT